MLIDLLSNSNTVTFNIKVANKIGLHAAIYLQELISINEKAIRKGKVINEKYFFVNRKYVTSRTTLDDTEQYSIDSTLSNLGIMSIDPFDRDVISLDLKSLVSVITNEDEVTNKNIASIVSMNSKNKKESKKKSIKDSLKRRVTTTNPELKNAYYKWIDSLFESGKKTTSAVVDQAQSFIDNVTNHDLDMALGILEKATLFAYIDMSWALERYNKDFKISSNHREIEREDVTIGGQGY